MPAGVKRAVVPALKGKGGRENPPPRVQLDPTLATLEKATLPVLPSSTPSGFSMTLGCCRTSFNGIWRSGRSFHSLRRLSCPSRTSRWSMTLGREELPWCRSTMANSPRTKSSTSSSCMSLRSTRGNYQSYQGLPDVHGNWATTSGSIRTDYMNLETVMLFKIPLSEVCIIVKINDFKNSVVHQWSNLWNNPSSFWHLLYYVTSIHCHLYSQLSSFAPLLCFYRCNCVCAQIINGEIIVFSLYTPP